MNVNLFEKRGITILLGTPKAFYYNWKLTGFREFKIEKVCA